MKTIPIFFTYFKTTEFSPRAS